MTCYIRIVAPYPVWPTDVIISLCQHPILQTCIIQGYFTGSEQWPLCPWSNYKEYCLLGQMSPLRSDDIIKTKLNATNLCANVMGYVVIVMYPKPNFQDRGYRKKSEGNCLQISLCNHYPLCVAVEMMTAAGELCTRYDAFLYIALSYCTYSITQGWTQYRLKWHLFYLVQPGPR